MKSSKKVPSLSLVHPLGRVMSEPKNSFMENIDHLFDEIDQFHDTSTQNINPIFYSLKNLDERYKDPSFIAKGGMKIISKVFDSKVNRYVAMATLHENASRELYDPFIREARLTALLEHPNIISIHDIGASPEGAPYFTMDLKIGDNLADMTTNTKSPEPLTKLLDIFLKTCDAVSFAHSNQVIHLDLKPENIQVGGFGEVLLCDWGLAKVLNEPDTPSLNTALLNPDLLNNITQHGRISGTPGYMAPELIKGSEGKTPSADIYALGCILFAILTSKPPIKGPSPEAILKKTLKSGVLSPQKAYPNKNISAGLSSIVNKAVAIDPSDRYSSATELSNDLRKYLDGYSTLAENASFIKELKLFYRRNKVSCINISLSLVSLIIITAFFINSLQTSRKSAENAWHTSEAYRKQAVEEKDKAINLLELYKKEQNWNEDLVKENYNIIRKKVEINSSHLIYGDIQKNFSSALNYLNRMIQNTPSSRWSHNQRAYLFFLTQQFDLALKDYATSKNGDKVLMALCKEFSNKAQSKQILPIDDLKSLINKLSKKPLYYPKLILLVRYDGTQRTSILEHSEAVEALVKTYNPDWRKGSFDFDPDKSSLLLKGPINKLSVDTKSFRDFSQYHNLQRVSLLKSLNPKSIILRDTKIKNFLAFTDLDVEILDIRGSLIKDISYIKQIKNLKKIIYKKGQLRPINLDSLPKGIMAEEL